MEYSDLKFSKRRALITQQIEASETQHFNKVIEKIANSRNVNTDAEKFDEELKTIEEGIVALREARAKLDAERDATEPAGPTVVEPVVEPVTEPGAHERASARGLPLPEPVDVSQPGNTPPAP
jgi:hypothetical protein